jgi:hypothetical protein
MRPFVARVANNLKHPGRLYSWWRYQQSRHMPHDCFFVTLPGSGTHWLRTMLSRALVDVYGLPEEIDSIRRDDLIPTYRVKTDRFKYNNDLQVPRIQHSHAFFSWLFSNSRTILLVRDLRDVMVSHYKTYVKMRDPDIGFSDFLRAKGVDRPGQKKNDTLRTLIGFLNSWGKGEEKIDEFYRIRYEDMCDAPEKEMKRLLQFIGFRQADADMVRQIVEFGSLANMRKMEQKNPLVQYQNKLSKVGEGKSGKYREYFNQSDMEYFCEVIKTELNFTYGYDYDRW